jgi:hypothetical protein
LPSGPPTTQASELRKLLDSSTLRRPRSIAGTHVHLAAEVRIPLDPTPSQAAAYRTVLTRSYELLADAKPSRHAGYRAAQMRNVCLELRKVRRERGEGASLRRSGARQGRRAGLWVCCLGGRAAVLAF